MKLPRFLKNTFSAAAAVVATAAAFLAQPADAHAKATDAQTIDVLFVYGQETENRYGGADGVKAQANLIVARTNTAFENSLITGAIRRAAVRKVNYTEVNFESDLNMLGASKSDGDPNGEMDEVHQWREEIGADVVNFIRSKPDYDNGTAGLAWLLVESAGNSGVAYSVAYGISFTHELGHNLGGCHDWGTMLATMDGRQQASFAAGAFGTPFGYHLPNGQGTIMSYNGTSILYYSNPDVKSNGVPTGTNDADPSTPEINYPANNAQVFNATIPLVAAYRPYKPGIPTPVFDPVSGVFPDEQVVTISCSDPDATIFYTTDGTDPDETSLVFRPTEPILIKYPTVLRARAFRADYLPSLIASANINIDYGRTLAPVTFAPDSGEYKGSVKVLLGCATDGAVIRYTLDGSDVTETSSIYRDDRPLEIVRTGLTVIKALPFLPKYNRAPQTSAEYTILVLPVAERPVVNIEGTAQTGGDGQTYNGPVTISLTLHPDSGAARPGDIIRYTVDNSEVTEDSPIYTGSFVLTRTANVKVRLWRADNQTSEERIVLVKINPVPVTRPVITPGGGLYVNSVTLIFSSNTPGLAAGSARPFLRYTLDGSTPTETSALYDPQNPPRLAHPATVKVRGFDIDFLPSEVTSADFNVRTPDSIRAEYGTRISGGSNHTLFLTGSLEASELRASGWNRYGQLGNGTTTTVNTPVIIGSGISAVSASGDHSLYVARDSKLWAAGRNNYGQLGAKDTTDRPAPEEIASEVLLAFAGGYHSFYTTFDGKFWAVGRNNYGQLGLGFSGDGRPVPAGTTSTIVDYVLQPTLVGEYFLTAAAGTFHSLFVRGDGTVWVTGRNDDGQLGLGDTADRNSPIKIATVTDFGAGGAQVSAALGKVKAVAAGRNFSLILTEAGSVYATGSNDSGQVGTAQDTRRLATPLRVRTPGGLAVTAIAAGERHALLLLSDGSLVGLGANERGQLGNDPAILPNTLAVEGGNAPVRVVAAGVKAIAAGAAHTLYVTSADSVESLGANTYGQLGDGTRTDRWQPSGGVSGSGTPVPAPVISPNGGVYTGSVRVEFKNIESEATVHFTQDGSAVTQYSPTYGNTALPLVNETSSDIVVTIRARAYRNQLGALPSDEVSAVFTIKAAKNQTPPAILRDPQSQTVVAGGAVTFAVSASGEPAPTFQWQFNGANLPGATFSSHTIENVTADHAGTYTVTISNSAGTIVSEAVLKLYGLPVITRQPRSASPFEGGDAEFSVEASVITGEPSTLSYQWRRDGVPLTGATGATLHLSGVRETQSGSYDVLVSNVAGTTQSSTVSLNVHHAANSVPEIIRQPAAPEVVWAGSKLVLSVGVAATDTAALTYQWQKRSGDSWSNVRDGTRADLIFDSVSAANNGEYRVSVENTVGSVVSTPVAFEVRFSEKPVVNKDLPRTIGCGLGRPFTLSVDVTGDPAPSYQWSLNGVAIDGATGAALTLPTITPASLGHYTVSVVSGSNRFTLGPAALIAIAPPKILSLPKGEIADPGRGAQLSVETSGSMLSFEWKRDGVTIAGATGPTYFAAETGKYTVVVSNGSGSVTQEIATLRSASGPAVTLATSAGNVVVVQGDPASNRVTLTATATGDAPFTFEWYKDGVKIPGTDNNSRVYETTVSVNTKFYVRITNAVGSATSNEVAVSVIHAPAIDRHPVSLDLREGEAGVLTVAASGTGPLSYQWYRNGTKLPDGKTPTLTFTSATQATGGIYYVIVDNPAGRPAKSSEVTVRVTAVTPDVGQIAAAPQAVAQAVSAGQGGAGATAATGASAKTGTFSLAPTGAAAAASTSTTVSGNAPVSLPAGTKIKLNGVLADSAVAAAVQTDDSVLTLLAGLKLPNGDYNYIRTGPNTALLVYSVVYGDDSFVRVETGVFEFVFTSGLSGSYVLRGSYDAISNKGSISDGTLDGKGDFKTTK
ncbi:MAG: immunoglobulin domain-containing protein [Puniceicoccales bacterium]|jgi:alpha-tubulin suppressor-like RCC1 family protein|nr:immunoglobulin domain-containing protein [Puniceicoccales bacterium]